MSSNKVNKLTLIAGIPIFLQNLGFSILQPKLKDIAVLGEDKFFSALSYFFINPEKISIEKQISAFDLFLLFLGQNVAIQQEVSNIFMLVVEDLEEIKFFDGIIILRVAGHECIIDEPKFLIIKETLTEIFGLEKRGDSGLNPANEAAKMISEKIKKRRELLSKEGTLDGGVFSNLISILAVGSNALTLDDCLNLTIYQIYNLIERLNLYTQYHIQIQSMMQGAEDVELVDWTKQI